MRREPEFFEEPELDLIYMARTLRSSLKLESILTEAGIDYLVEPGPYTTGILMKRDLIGAFFYVAPQASGRARDVLSQNRYKPYGSTKPQG